jgi:hypothetical protein
MVSKKKYYLIIIPICVFLSFQVGYLFENPNSQYLDLVNSVGAVDAQVIAEIESDISNYKYYNFNNKALIISLVLFIVIAFFIRNTIYYDKIGDFFNRIKRK